MVRMDKNRTVFAFIVGSAIFLVGLMALGGGWREWQAGHSGSSATNTALAARAVNISLTATAVMMAEAVRRTEVALAEAERSLAAASTAIAAPAAVAGGVAQVTKEGLRLEVVAVNYDA